MDKLVVQNWGMGPIKVASPFSLVTPVGQMVPTELHLKEDGDKDDKPSFLIVFDAPIESPMYRVVGHISLRMLTQALDELGYTLTAK
jgi:hypothetical protein